MSRCDQCAFSIADCMAREVHVVRDDELESEAFRRAVRALGASCRVPYEKKLDFFSDCYRDAPCATVVDGNEAIVFELNALEFNNVRYWLRDQDRLPPDDVPTRLRPERKEAFRAYATLLKIIFPSATAGWTKPNHPAVFVNGRWETIH